MVCEDVEITISEDSPDIALTIAEDAADVSLTINEDAADIGITIAGDFSRFTSLLDTPNAYSGYAGKSVAVNSSEDGLEFITVDTDVEWGEITGTLSNQTDLQAALDLKTDNTDFLSHIGDSTIHFTESSIDHTAIQNIGTNTHAQIDTHIANVTTNPHAVTKVNVGLGNVDNVQQMPLSYLDTDVTLSADSDVKVPSQKAIKSYVDTIVNAAIRLQGDWDADTNTPDITGTTTTGFAWRVSVAGATDLGGITSWAVGDLAVKTDASWLKVDNEDIAAIWGNIVGTLSNQTDLQAELDAKLNLDQTSQQTITNNIPLLTGLTPTTDYEIATKKYVDDNDFWQRVGTVLSPANTGDEVHIDNSSGETAEWKKVDTDGLMSVKDNVTSVGGPGQALYFSGANEYAENTTASVPSSDACTFSGWFYFKDIDDGILNYVFATSNGTSFPSNIEFTFYLGGSLRDYAGVVIGNNEYTASTTAGSFNAPADENRWVHIAITYDKNASSGDRVHIWKDGVDITSSESGTPPTLAQSNRITIGRRIDSWQYSDVVYDECGYWSKKLSDNDITDLYNSGTGLYVSDGKLFPTDGGDMGDDLEMIYHFDEGTGTSSTADSSTNGFNLTLNNIVEGDWEEGKVPSDGIAKEINVLQSRDGITALEFGAVELGDDDVRAAINGKTIRFNIDSVEVGQIDENGDLLWDNSIQINDNEKLFLGEGSDASITYDGTDLIINPAEVGTGDVNVSTSKITNVVDPTADQDAATKKYVDDNDFWDRTGTVLSPETAGDEVHIENPTEGETFEIKKIDANALTTLKDNVTSVGGIEECMDFSSGAAITVPVSKPTMPLTITFWSNSPDTGSALDGIFDSAPGTADVLRQFDGDIQWHNSDPVKDMLSTADTWHFYAVVFSYDGNRHIEVYKDSVSLGTADGGISSTFAWNNFTIGNINGSIPYNGKLQDFCIFERELSQADIDTMWNSGNGLFGDVSLSPWNNSLLAGYHLNDGSGSIAADFSGNGETGSISGTPIWTTGKLTASGIAKEITVLQSSDGIGASEFGAVELGDDDVRTTLNGKTLRFNIDSTEVAQFDEDGNLDLLDNDINNVGEVLFNTSHTPSSSVEGLAYWNGTDKTINVDTGRGPILQVGQESYLPFSLGCNESGVTIPDGSVVYLSNDGSKITVSLANSRDPDIQGKIVGITTESIDDGACGFVTTYGLVRGLDTSSYSLGDTLYVSPTVDGGLTTTRPTAGDYVIPMAVVETVDAVNGSIFIRYLDIRDPDDIKNATGFPEQNAAIKQSDVTFANSDRTLRISPNTGGGYNEFYIWQLGVKYLFDSEKSVQIPNEEGTYWIYFDEGVLNYIKNPTPGDQSTLIRTKVLVAMIYWSAETGKEGAIMIGDERHGHVMSSDTHAYFHFADGARWISGLTLNTLDVNESGNNDAHAQFGVDSGTITDEDLINIISTIGSTDGLPILYLEGADANLRRRNNIYDAWEASTAYALEDRVLAVTGNANTRGLIFECTTAGTSGGTEPTWQDASGPVDADGGDPAGATTTDNTVTWTCVGSVNFSVVNFVGGDYRLAWNNPDGGGPGLWGLTEVTNNDFVLCHVFATNSKQDPVVAFVGQANYGNRAAARAGAESEISTIITNYPSPELVPLATIIFQTGNGNLNAVKAKTISTDEGDDYVDWRTTAITPGASPSAHPNLSTLAWTSAGHSSSNLVDEFAGFNSLGAATTFTESDYILTDGTRAFTGNVDLGANSLTVNSIEVIGADGEVNAAAIEDKFLKNDASDTTTGTITAANFNTAGNLTDGVNSLTIANAKTAYDHSQDNTQAHSDYLINDGNDTTTGTLTMASGSVIGNLTLGNGSITDSSGAISFNDENLTTTGDISGADISASGDVSVGAFLGLTNESQTISSGVITATKGYVTIDTEGAAATDDLDGIAGGSIGDIIILKSTSATRNVVVKNDSGYANGDIQLRDGKDFTLISTFDSLTLMRVSAGLWHEIARTRGSARSHISVSLASASAQTIANNTWVTLLCDTEAADELGEYSGATGRFTAKTEGYYQINTNIRWESATSTKIHYLSIYKNGSSINGISAVAPVTGRYTQALSHCCYLNVGDYIELVVRQASTGNEDCSGVMSIVRII